MFVNYFTDEARSSPINLAIARLVLGFWVIWKTIWYDWPRMVESPYRLTTNWEWAVPTAAPWILTVQQWLLIGMVGFFIVGYRVRVTAAVSSLLLAYLGNIRTTVNVSGEASNLYLGALILLFFALYAETDELSIDGAWRTPSNSPRRTVERIVSSTDRSFPMPALKYNLVLLAMLYFSSGLSKILTHGGIGFVAPDHLTRLILIRSSRYPWYEAQKIVVEYPILASIGGIATMVLELGTLVAVVTGVGFSLFMTGLVAFAASNVIFLGIFFSDNLFFVGMFFAFDRLYAKLVRDRQLDVIFDSRDSAVIRLLYPFSLLDVNDTVMFVPQREATAPIRSTRDGDSDSGILVIHGTSTFEGYDAVLELVRQFRIFFWAAWLMRSSLVERFGTRAYRYVAADGSQRVDAAGVD